MDPLQALEGHHVPRDEATGVFVGLDRRAWIFEFLDLFEQQPHLIEAGGAERRGEGLELGGPGVELQRRERRAGGLADDS
jgi:hypothetical protein